MDRETLLNELTQKKQEIEVALKNVESHKQDQQNYLTKLEAHISAVEKLLEAQGACLTMTETLKAQKDIHQLRASFSTLKNAQQPKRFAFSKATAAPAKTTTSSSAGASAPVASSSSSGAAAEMQTIESLLDGEHTVRIDDLRNVVLRNCKNAIIYLTGCAGSLHVLGLEKCQLRCDPIKGSALLERCVDCTITMAEHQIRIHESLRCDFHLHTATHPIIENCNSLRFFGHYSIDSDQSVQSEKLQKANLLGIPNAFADVKDFNWLQSASPSPHFQVVH